MSTINLGATSSSKAVVPPYFSDVVTLRVLKYKMGKDDKNVPRIELETEIAAPNEVEVDGVKYELAGQTIKFYLGTSDERAGKAQQSPLATLKEFHEKLSLPMEIDPDNLPYEGLLFEFALSSTERKLQRKNRQGEYEVVLGPDGKARTLGWQWNNFISNVLGPSSLDNSSF